MANVPGYVQRYTRVLRALEALWFYPDGLPLAQLAEELGATPDDLRQEILAYYTAEPAVVAGYRLPGIGWVTPMGEEDDPETAEVVILTDPDALGELGVVRLSTEEMATVWRAGLILSEYEPENLVLAEALKVLAEGWLDSAQTASGPGSGHVSPIRAAIRERRALRIRYAREWRPGVSTRVVHPYRLICTHRGWELDAGPLDEAGAPRTFLLSNVSELEILDEEFVVPDDVMEILRRNRAQIRVELSLPQRTSWGVDTQADRAESIRSDQETTTIAVELSPPYAARLALILAPTNGQGMLMDHRGLAPEIRSIAARLLQHHRFALP